MSSSTTSKVRMVCDICRDPIFDTEGVHDDGDEVAHTACVPDWFRRNFGRETLS